MTTTTTPAVEGGRTILDHTHGAVNNRCDHHDCQNAFKRWSKQYDLDRHRGIDRTLDATLTRHHIATLEGAGWSRRGIAGAAEVSPTAISRIANGQRTIRRPIADAILALDPRSLPTKPSLHVTEPFVPRIGTVRRIQALLTLGWTHDAQHRASGVKTAVVLQQGGRWVSQNTHNQVAAMYRDLAHRTGPSAITRRRAAQLGYHSPLDWHDIDHDTEADIAETETVNSPDTDADPVVIARVLAGERIPTNRAERFEIVARWPYTGRPYADLERLGWKPERYRTTDQTTSDTDTTGEAA